MALSADQGERPAGSLDIRESRYVGARNGSRQGARPQQGFEQGTPCPGLMAQNPGRCTGVSRYRRFRKRRWLPVEPAASAARSPWALQRPAMPSRCIIMPRTPRPSSLSTQISRGGGTAIALTADLADEAAVKRLLPDAAAALGPIGVSDQQRIHIRERYGCHGNARQLGRTSVNQPACSVCADAGFRVASPADSGGVVINLLDERVWNLTPYFVSYTVSKTGLWTLTRTMALALAPRIRVNAIGPGPTLPNLRQTPAQFLDRCRNMPLRRGTSPREVAAAMRFILEAPAMTGQMIALDGGEHLGWAQPGYAPILE